MTKRIRLIAGPNGSGKTTLFHELEKQIPVYDFINADEMKLLLEKEGHIELPFDFAPDELMKTVISSSFSDSVKAFLKDGSIRCSGRNVIFSPEAINSYSVAALADFIRNAYMKRGISFTMETVFSHQSKIQFLARSYEMGFRIYLYFIATDSPEINVERVKQRVSEGGHDVPKDKIIERYYRCLDNFHDSLPFAYRAFFLDNSLSAMRLFAELKPDHKLEIAGKIPAWFEHFILKKFQLYFSEK